MRESRTTFEYLKLVLRATLLRVFVYVVLRVYWLFHAPPMTAPVRVERIRIPSREPGRTIRVIKYTPKSLPSQGPHKVHLNWHGSGFILSPVFGSDRQFCSEAAAKLDAIVLDCDYRKAPEHPYPIPLQDVEDAILYVHAHPELYDSKNVSVSGFSAGGCLALSACVSLGRGKIRAVSCVYPATDLSRPRDGPKDPRLNPVYRSGRVISKELATLYMDCYLPPNINRKDPIVSPALADASHFPDHTFIACGDADTLYFDGKSLIENLQTHGTPAQRQSARFMSVPEQAHGFNLMVQDHVTELAVEAVFTAAIDAIRASRVP